MLPLSDGQKVQFIPTSVCSLEGNRPFVKGLGLHAIADPGKLGRESVVQFVFGHVRVGDVRATDAVVEDGQDVEGAQVLDAAFTYGAILKK